MISDIFLGVISIGLLVAFCFYVWNDRKEHSKLINAIKASTNQDFVNSELTDKVTLEKPKIQEQDTAIEDIDDDTYINLITKNE